MKIIKAEDRELTKGPAGPKRTPQEKAARKVAIENTQRRYITLACEHYTTLETDDAYSYWRPRKGVSFCETCGTWRPFRKPVKRVRDTNQEPLF